MNFLSGPSETLDRNSGKAFSGGRAERVARMISERIARHELQAGARLPSENALAGHFGVSRAVVREAIAMLKAEGLVETLQGSGAYVRARDAPTGSGLDNLTRASISALIDLIEVRKAVEAEIAARAATHRSESQMRAIDTALERLNRAQNEHQRGASEDRAFHASIADASGNPYWVRVTEALAKSIEIAIDVTRQNEALRRDFLAETEEEHRELREAVAARDPERARIAATHHMEQAARRILSADQEFWSKTGARVTDLPTAD